MTDQHDVFLLPTATLTLAINEATLRLKRLLRVESRYRNLVEVASIHQELGNSLSKQIYDEAPNGRRPKIACAAGCSTCCLIPSMVRRDNANSFVMTVLDVVTLIENYPQIKAANESLLDKAKTSVEQARLSNDVAPCPHLDRSGACGIYNRRPVACKIWFSADLQLCVQNKSRNYPRGVNPLTDASNNLREAFEMPFKDSVREIAPDMRFSDYDYLETFREIALIDSLGLLDTLKHKLNSTEINEWNPLDSADRQQT